MKKLLILLCFFLLIGCAPKPDLSYEVESYPVDMSVYDGVTSVGHAFVGVAPTEVFRAIQEKGSAIFYLGYGDCAFCQKYVKHLNKVAMDLGVTVCYIDAKSKTYPLTNELMDDLIVALYDVLRRDENGEKALYTPHIFTIINGKIASSQISMTETDDPVKDGEKLEKIYRKMLEPFVQ